MGEFESKEVEGRRVKVCASAGRPRKEGFDVQENHICMWGLTRVTCDFPID